MSFIVKPSRPGSLMQQVRQLEKEAARATKKKPAPTPEQSKTKPPKPAKKGKR